MRRQLNILLTIVTVAAILSSWSVALARDEISIVPKPAQMEVKGKTDAEAPRSARALLQRLLPDHVDQFAFEVIGSEHGRDVFELETRGGKVVIRGNTGVSMAMGLNWYLKHYCHCHVSLRGKQLNLPKELPEIENTFRKVCWAKHRYFLNYCAFGYSLPWWHWSQWEEFIDWMALNGINAPLAVTGQEATWQAVCKRLGMNDEQIREFLAGPPYLPFQWMGCLDGWGGPLPQSWIDSHEQLQKKILARERELGMTPVLQGFTGHVPPAIIKLFPKARTEKVRWIEWNTCLLDPIDPLFQKVAKIFMEEQTRRFGTDHLYATDTFIEMKPPSNDVKYLANLGRAIYNGMSQSDPEAVWLLQGWIFINKASFWKAPQAKALFDVVPDDRMILIDMKCEHLPCWSKTEAFYGKQWLWCNIQNFGNKVVLEGALNKIAAGLPAARRNPKSGKLAGLGFVNEGLGYNPVVYDLMFEMAWRHEPVELETWITEYAHHRYGRKNVNTVKAWQKLLNVYRAQHSPHSAITTYPRVTPLGRPYGSPNGPDYSNRELAGVWKSLLAAGDELKAIDTFRFDLVNVARQVLSNHSNALQRKVAEAYRAKDSKAFRKASDDFLGLLMDIDELLATREEFLLGKNLKDAKRWGTTPQEKAIFEWNARRVVTLWGTGHLNDYARKEWSGMISGYYHARWKWYLDKMAKSLETNKPFDNQGFRRDLRKWMVEWSDAKESYPSEPTGESVVVAKKLWKKYRDAFKP